jgi:hypothetical protein
MIKTLDDPKTKATMEYSEINYDGHRYILNIPEIFTMLKEGNGTLLENERLDIYASGKTLGEATEDLFFQFSHSYHRFINIDDSKLSERLLSVKKYYQFLVKSVETI